MRGTSALLLACFAAVGCPKPGEPSAAPEAAEVEATNEPPAEAPAGAEERLRTVYVPAYSHLPKGDGPPVLFSVLLSVRNMDTATSVTLTHVDYFDTSGHRVRRYLKAPRALRPLETAEFSVQQLDEAGGSGANFLVYWRGPADAHPLLTEAVMVGQVGSGQVGFTSRGVELARRPDPESFQSDSEDTTSPATEAVTP